MRLYYRIFGYRRLSFALSDAANALNICMKYGYPYRDMRVEGERVSLTFTLFSASRFAARCREREIKVFFEPARGIPAFFGRYLVRPGVVLGFLFAALTVFFSGRFVWDVRVSGNVSLTCDEVKEVLADSGLSVGSYIPSLNTNRTEGRAMLLCNRIAWISVNMSGNVAYVEVMEKIPNDQEKPSDRPANLVAAREGTVVEFIAYSGHCELSVGDTVKPGDLLIGGVYGEKTPGVVLTRAAGYVKAKTFREFEVKIPLEHTEKIPVSTFTGSRSLIFFNNRIKVFAKSRNSGATCDTIEEEKYISLFGRRLPFGISEEKVLEYREEKSRYTEGEAAAVAREKLDAMIHEELADATIISREESGELRGGVYILKCGISCIENIAELREIGTGKSNDKEQ